MDNYSTWMDIIYTIKLANYMYNMYMYVLYIHACIIYLYPIVWADQSVAAHAISSVRAETTDCAVF